MRPWAPLTIGLAAALGGCSSDTLEMGPDAPAAGGFSDVTAVTLATTTVAPGEEGGVSDDPWPYDLGSCVTWDQDEAIPVFEIVSCDDEHLVEVTIVYAIEVASDAASFPTRDDLDAFATEYCDDAAVQYLQAELTQEVETGAIPPSPDEWGDGERWIACTVGQTRVDGRRPPYTGRLGELQ
jgi:hypothetical protein